MKNATRNLTCFALLFFSVSTFVSQQEQNASKGIEESKPTWQSQLDEQSLNSLRRLSYGEDIGSSLFAKWIECKLKCSGATKVATNSAKHEFVGFLSGKTNAPVPEWWRAYILAVDPNLHGDLPEQDMNISNTFGLSHESKVKLTKLDDEFVSGTFNGDQFRIKWSNEETEWVLDDGEEPRDALAFFSLAKLPEGEYLFAMSNRFCGQFDVVRITAEGKIVWRSQVNNVVRFHRIAIDSEWNGRIGVVVDESTARVFGVNSAGFFLDVFDFESGEPKYRFNTQP